MKYKLKLDEATFSARGIAVKELGRLVAVALQEL